MAADSASLNSQPARGQYFARIGLQAGAGCRWIENFVETEG